MTDALGDYLPLVEETIADLARREVVERIWRRDQTVWRPDPTEITDRLGWLTVGDQMRDQIPALQALADEARREGYRHAVLLGMGGSSLGPEVLRQTFGSAPGYPQLQVLDSTVPAWVQRVTDTIDPARTLFLVSSKSGSTIEPNSFYAHFRRLVEEAVGTEPAGRHFLAVTDPGTVLETLAREQGFRRAFLNPTDIGGRYSVLSYFGLVPAALLGLDLTRLLDRAGRMRQECAAGVPIPDHPGAWLGAVMGALAGSGRNKLTLVASPSIASFGLWVEQLLAESTGKEGTGIVPVADEPLLPEAGAYGADRLFVYLRCQGDDNAATDAFLERMSASGHPVVQLDLKDAYDLGAEFYRWEFATAVAGSLLDIQPFDQPDVQGAKDQTDRVLAEHRTSGVLPALESHGDLAELLAQLHPGDYLAIMAYLPDTLQIVAAVSALRRRILERYRVATTFGFGPRFLHSTGQLHKGGPPSGAFLQLTGDHGADLPVPGKPYTFRVLADAQALGDFQALRDLGRRAVRIHLGTDPAAHLGRLLREVG